MKKFNLLILSISFFTFSCGPSEKEVKEHEQKRDSVEQTLEEDWEADLEEMMEETTDSSKNDSVK